jgi:hypothetical protein
VSGTSHGRRTWDTSAGGPADRPGRNRCSLITTRPRHDPHRLPAGLGLDQEPPQPREVAVQPRPRPGGRIVVPHPVDQRLGRHRPPGIDRQRDQDRALPGRPQLHRPAGRAQLHRAEHPQLHHGFPSAALPDLHRARTGSSRNLDGAADPGIRQGSHPTPDGSLTPSDPTPGLTDTSHGGPEMDPLMAAILIQHDRRQGEPT